MLQMLELGVGMIKTGDLWELAEAMAGIQIGIREEHKKLLHQEPIPTV